MASAIASPTPLPPSVKRPARTDLQMQDDGRGTPVPQYERTQSVPFTLTLQEEKNNPGQFQLVVNIDPQHQPSEGTPPTPATSKKLYANLNDVSALGLNAPALYQTQKSSPPLSPSQDKHEWSDLDAIPQDFLHKVVPDWKVTFSRSDSTASTQSKRLSDIKARIKKKGKGYVVRLLKGSDPESNEVAEVHLGQQSANDSSVVQELDSKSKPNPVELEAINEPATVLANEPATPIGIFEIGTSNEPGVECNPVAAPSTPTPPPSAIPQWLNQVSAVGLGPHSSIAEEGFSDAETLIPEVRSIVERLDDEQTEAEPFSGPSTSFPTRSGSVLSIVKTPTRGLSVVGPVRRIEKSNLRRAKGKNPRFDLNRSDARKSFRRSPNSSISAPSKERVLSGNDPSSSVLRNRLHAMNPRDNESTSEYSSGCYNARQHVTEEPELTRQKLRRGASVEEDFLSPNKAKTKAKLRLQTNVPRSKSANTSPVTRRKRSPRTHKPTSSSSSSISLIEENDTAPKTDPSVQLRDAIKRAFTEEGVDEEPNQEQAFPSIPRIEEPVDESRIGEILLPAELEIRSPPVLTRSPVMTFWGLAVSGLAEKVLEGIHMLRQRYGSEPPVPPKHVRVRWTCSCGEPLYDDFIERRPGAARLLEAYLNRPRAHTPASPTSRSSTATSMSSVFSSASTASTLATPSSTYGGPSFWGRLGESSKYSPRLRTNTPFNIPIGSFAEESWLLTCANEGRFTPKIVHIDVNAARIRSDKDLAIAIREHYEQLNRRWYNWIRLRGLSTIEFVQFEVHRNRFADIRATPSMPPVSTSTTTSIDASTSTSTSEKPTSPSQHPYNFEPIDLLPPVGSTYLLHLFQHPSDYDGELITYLRSPKRRERLDFGMGWGINLVEGFLAQRVWAVLMALFGMGSAVFAIFWTVRKGDVQGAFGVAAWLLGLAGLVLGCVQAWLE